MSIPEFRTAVPSDNRRPCGLIVTHVWQEQDPEKLRVMLTKYRLADAEGNPIGTFHTPATSRLSEALLKFVRESSINK